MTEVKFSNLRQIVLKNDGDGSITMYFTNNHSVMFMSAGDTRKLAVALLKAADELEGS